jgi:TRAP-type C4-dicarboxylate transport system substrate-binding protein
MMRLLSRVLLAALLVSPLVASAQAKGKVVTWRVQSHYPSSSPSYQDSVIVVAEKIKERTGGRLVLEPFPADALMPSNEIFNAVKRGMIPAGVSAAGYFRAQLPVVGLAHGLPYSFKDSAQAAHFIKKLGYEKMVQDSMIKRHGVLFYVDRAYPTELVTKKPIQSYDDFKGMKLRSAGVLQKFLTAAGATATSIPGGEVYTSLSTGVIDGAHWGAAIGALGMNLYDSCKFHMKPPLTVAGTDVWLINQKAFEGLPKDVQKIVVEILEEHFWSRTAQYDKQEEEALARAQKEKGVTVVTLPAADQKRLTQLAEKIWDEEAQTDPEYGKAIQMMKDYLKSIGEL